MTVVRISFNLAGEQVEAHSSTDQTLLELMQQLAIPVRQACRNGSCGICKCRLTKGQISYFLRAPFGLRDEQIAEGYILSCIAYPVSDLSITASAVDQKKY
jgi:ferredoxin